MDIDVYIDKRSALEAGMDRWGLMRVEVPMSSLSLRQRQVLGVLITEYHSANRDVRCEQSTAQAFAPRVYAPGVAGVVEVIDRVLLAMQREEQSRAREAQKRAAREAEELAAEQVEAQNVYREFVEENSRGWDCSLIKSQARLSRNTETVVCGICQKSFPGREIQVSYLGKVLSQDQQERVLELAKDRYTQVLVFKIDRHLEQCKAKANQKLLQSDELVSLFLEGATEEQNERWKAGYVSKAEMRTVVRDRLFAVPRRLSPVEWQELETYPEIRRDIVRAENIDVEQLAHNEVCGEEPEYLRCDVVDVEHLDAVRYRFLQCVKMLYLHRSRYSDPSLRPVRV